MSQPFVPQSKEYGVVSNRGIATSLASRWHNHKAVAKILRGSIDPPAHRRGLAGFVKSV
jgi:hypothetical protein